jgi:phosphatidylserine synthase
MSQFTTQWILPIITFCLGILMVSNIRFPAPAKKILWKQHPFIYLALFAGLLVLVITNTGLTLFIIFIAYLLYGLITHIRSRVLKRSSPSVKPTIAESGNDAEQ